MTASPTRLGRIGERMAARHLVSAGMTILAANWRCQVDDLRGELDLVARDGNTVVFCEVKTRRRATPAGPLEGITPSKLLQIRRLGGVWLAEHEPGRVTVRVDAIGVHWPLSGGRPVITHLRGIDA